MAVAALIFPSLLCLLVRDSLIHVLDEVLLPPTVGELLQLTTNVTASPPFDFSTVLRLAQGPAKLGPLLFSDDNAITLFAPLQVAFDQSNVTNKAINGLLQEPSRWWMHVRNLIEHHCIEREIRYADLIVGTLELQMLSGYNVSLQVFSEGNVTNDDLGHLNLVDGNYYAYPNFTINGHTNVTVNNLVAVNG
jgi:uncharacterized surface protein with fasciclin (FAS1) repeats